MDITTKEYLKDILNIDVDIVKKRKNASKKNVGTSNSIKIGHVVKLKDCSNKELLTVKIVGVHQNKTYKRMGGSYYGNQTDVSYVGNGVGEKNGVYNISIESPMGRSILGKKSGDTFSVTERDGKIATYKILSIK
ncbi:MAG: GreA/GreB family elongation factor [Clostridia bacterium]|nr:GreA/GreB family elongation factor [Clostridia bacterium]